MKIEKKDAYIITGVVSLAAGILLASWLYTRQQSRDPLRVAEKLITECRSKIEEIEKDLAAMRSSES